MKVKRTIEVAAPPARVFELLADPHRLGEWVTIHAGLEEAPAGSLRKGSKLKQALKLAGKEFTVRWTVVDSRKPHRIEWEGRGPARTEARAIYELSPSGEGTRFGYLNEFELPGGVFGKVLGSGFEGKAGREADKSLKRLKKLLEG